MATPTVSVVIPNYNYGRFVGEAVESALLQPDVEVVVVDDGSTDDSRAVLARYRDRVTLIEKRNEGQLSALNVGVDESNGDIVQILDADDVLLPDAATSFRAAFVDDPSLAKVHWPVRLMDVAGRPKNRCRPDAHLPAGDLRSHITRRGPDGYPTPPTSGNAWSRAFLREVFPLPERPGRASADGYLSMLAPLYGPVAAIHRPLTHYRSHSGNVKVALAFDALLDRNLELWEWRAEILAEHCTQQGLLVDPQRWRDNAWIHWLDRARREVAATIPFGEPFLLLDESRWGMCGDASWHAVPFTEQDGQYAGPPSDGKAAVAEIQRQIRAGVEWSVLAWPAAWYLDHYPELAALLDRMTTVLVNEQIRIHRLTEPT